MSAPEPDDHVPTPGAVERIGTLLRCGPFAKGMDIRLVSSGEGRAVLEMEITEPLTNNKGTCHGGALFTLADTAFGVAAHYGGPVVTVGSAGASRVSGGTPSLLLRSASQRCSSVCPTARNASRITCSTSISISSAVW